MLLAQRNYKNDNTPIATLKCSQLPDGRVYLLSNAMIFVDRDPLFLTTSEFMTEHQNHKWICSDAFLLVAAVSDATIMHGV